MPPKLSPHFKELAEGSKPTPTEGSSVDKDKLIEILLNDIKTWIILHNYAMDKCIVQFGRTKIEEGRGALYLATTLAVQPSIKDFENTAILMAAGKQCQGLLDLFEEQKEKIAKREADLLENHPPWDTIDAIEYLKDFQFDLVVDCRKYGRELFGWIEQWDLPMAQELRNKDMMIGVYLDDDFREVTGIAKFLEAWTQAIQSAGPFGGPR